MRKPVRDAPSSAEGIERVIGGYAVATDPTDGLIGNIAEIIAEIKIPCRHMG